MARPAPEWISTTLVQATLVEGGTARPVRIQVGLVRLPGGAGVRIASAVEGRNELFVLPPVTVARIIGALNRSLLE